MENKNPKKWRLGLDLGETSLGWCLYSLNAEGKISGVAASGTRIFSSGRDEEKHKSLNEIRRAKRLESRQRDRKIRRKSQLINALVESGLMPREEAERRTLLMLNPYELRYWAAESVIPPAEQIPASLSVSRKLAETLTKTDKGRILRPHHIGRATFHMAQRRGFQSNLKTVKKGGDEDEGKIKAAIDKTEDLISKHTKKPKTFGQFLYLKKGRSHRALPIRARKGVKDPVSPDLLYPSRHLIEKEFRQIWKAQKPHYGNIFTEATEKEIHRAIFHQRDLKDPIVGRCIYYLGDTECGKCDHCGNDSKSNKRTPRALPSFQEFRALQTVNNLRIQDDDEKQLDFSWNPEKPEDWARIEKARAQILKQFSRSDWVTFEQMKKILRQCNVTQRDAVFTHEEGGDKKRLHGNITGNLFGKSTAFGEAWHRQNLDAQDEFIHALIDAKNDDKAKSALKKFAGDIGVHLDEKKWKTVLTSYSELPKGHSHMCEKAIGKMLPLMRKGMRYDQAAEESFGAHTREVGPGNKKRLPPYQQALKRYCVPRRKADENNPEKWRIPNPTVHVGLNQVRLVINDIIRIHKIKNPGKELEIAVELARDLLNNKDRAELMDFQNRRKKENERLNGLIEEPKGKGNATLDDRKLLRIWMDQGPPNNRRCVFCAAKSESGKKWGKPCIFCRPNDKKRKANDIPGVVPELPRCPFCPRNGANAGKTIGIAELFSGDGQYHIAHILPRSKTGDDSPSNLVIACKDCNEKQGNKTPYEWLKNNLVAYQRILERARLLPKAKHWRFQPNAMEVWEKNRGFLNSQLAATRYLGRVTLRYLEEICPRGNITIIKGSMTARLRKHWHLNRILNAEGKNIKNRNDHRHHAIDAAVIGIAAGKAFTQMITTAAMRAEKKRADDFVNEIPTEPMPGFGQMVEDAIIGKQINGNMEKPGIVVSYKPNRKKQSGRLFQEYAYGKREENGERWLVRRVPIRDLTFGQVVPDAAGKRKKKIADPRLAKILRDRVMGLNQKEFDEALDKFAGENNIKYVRLMEKAPSTAKVIRHASGKHYKVLASGGNVACRIYRISENEMSSEIITAFDLAQHRTAKRIGQFPKAKLEMELRHGDMLVINPTRKDMAKLGGEFTEGMQIIAVVRNFSPKLITLAIHNVAVHSKNKREVPIGLDALNKRNPEKSASVPPGWYALKKPGKAYGGKNRRNCRGRAASSPVFSANSAG